MPPEITRDDVAHLAGLARIALCDAELDRLGPELPKILEYVATVPEALEGREDVEPMSHPVPVTTCSARTSCGPRSPPRTPSRWRPPPRGSASWSPRSSGRSD